MTDPLAAATQFHGMANKAGNEKLAFALTGLSVALGTVILIRELSHCVQEAMRQLPKDSNYQDRRR